MRFLFFIGFMACWWWGCESEKAALQKTIQELETQAATNPSDKQLRPLLATYLDYEQKFGEDPLNAVYLYRSSEIYYRTQNWKEAAKKLEVAIQKYPTHQIMPQMLAFAGMIYEENLTDLERAEVVYQRLLDEFPENEQSERARFFFKPADEKLRFRIEKTQKLVHNDNQRDGLNRPEAEKLVLMYALYIKSYNDDYTPVFCEKGAKTASLIGYSFTAIQFLDKIIQDYPDHVLYPSALLWMGAFYENDMPNYRQLFDKKRTKHPAIYKEEKQDALYLVNDLEQAKYYYKRLIKEFPKDPLAEVARNSLSILGKDPNEFINMIKEREQKDTARLNR